MQTIQLRSKMHTEFKFFFWIFFTFFYFFLDFIFFRDIPVNMYVSADSAIDGECYQFR